MHRLLRLMIDALADGLVDDATARLHVKQIRKHQSSMTAPADDLIAVGLWTASRLGR